MHLDVQDLHAFYYRSTLGRAVQKVLRDKLRQVWPDTKGRTVAGFGFAAPLLRPFLSDARRVMALMPAQQGVIHWPAGQPNVSVLTEEVRWPVETGHIDRLVVLHGLDSSEHPTPLFDEIYRVLGPGGRVVFIVPNRSGLWARSETTPFGFGRPYSSSQLDSQLKWHDFVPGDHASLLYQPPSTRKIWRKTSGFWEQTGQKIPGVMAGGVLMVEATKKYPPRPRGAGERARPSFGILTPSPEVKPV
ncbi:class I SAM-dependent methyltransferase [Primorskyibacter sp. S187A]|uniref:class I SAM-dependent methyltransferase n=1 Tax=Primorskyibacter sp. S187A TaxID=3415130 RepID=UPI003C79A8FE